MLKYKEYIDLCLIAEVDAIYAPPSCLDLANSLPLLPSFQTRVNSICLLNLHKSSKALLWRVRQPIFRSITTQIRRTFLQLKIPNDECQHQSHLKVSQSTSIATPWTHPKSKQRSRCRIEHLFPILLDKPSVRLKLSHIIYVPRSHPVFSPSCTRAAKRFVDRESR